MSQNVLRKNFFDDNFPSGEQLPRIFNVSFKEIVKGLNPKVIITINNEQIGNLLTDNSYDDDGYRFHDVFHFAYVAVLGWSPCVRKMLGRKRKSDVKVDEVEDGARAIITEEAISLLVFYYAQENNFLENTNYVNSDLLETIAKLTFNFEVKDCNLLQWEQAILQGYLSFRNLVKHKGGTVRIDMLNQKLSYLNN